MTQKQPVHLTSLAPSKSPISESPISSGSIQLNSSLPQPSFILSTIVTTSSTPPSTQTIAPRAKSQSQQQTTLLPSASEPTPSIPIISEPNPFEPQTYDLITSSPPLLQFNIHITSILISESIMFNEPISPRLSSNHCSSLIMT